MVARSSHFDQAEYDVRCEWALEGLLALGESSDAMVIVDVLSFSTAVDIALGCGASVLPYRWKDDSATAFAAERGAVLAAGRSSGGYSLSPASLRAIPAGTLLVLPSPNGATLAASAAAAPVYTACLRNAPAVAQQAARHGPRIAVIPAGEQWCDASLRPCLEDLVGAGAVLAGLPGTLSPEAELRSPLSRRFATAWPPPCFTVPRARSWSREAFPRTWSSRRSTRPAESPRSSWEIASSTAAPTPVRFKPPRLSAATSAEPEGEARPPPCLLCVRRKPRNRGDSAAQRTAKPGNPAPLSAPLRSKRSRWKSVSTSRATSTFTCGRPPGPTSAPSPESPRA
jgi:2-phosphosulfolactate phosphatase